MNAKEKIRKVSLSEYAANYNPRKNRRGYQMSESYLYRLIRRDIETEGDTGLWFKYTLEGNKGRIYILLD